MYLSSFLTRVINQLQHKTVEISIGGLVGKVNLKSLEINDEDDSILNYSLIDKPYSQHSITLSNVDNLSFDVEKDKTLNEDETLLDLLIRTCFEHKNIELNNAMFAITGIEILDEKRQILSLKNEFGIASQLSVSEIHTFKIL